MFLSLIKIYPTSGREHNVIEVLDSMKGPVAALADCLDCSVAVEWGEGGAVCYMELWQTREAFDRQLRSALFCRVLEAMELSKKPPLIDFFEINSIGGMELLETLCVSKMEANTQRNDSEACKMNVVSRSEKGRNKARRMRQDTTYEQQD